MGVTTIVSLAVVLKKSKDRPRLLALYFVFFGLTLVMETVLLIYLKAYDYYPKVFPADWFMDSLFGNLFSQASLACTGLIIGLYDLNILWQMLFVALYSLIEITFLALGIYSHRWYRTWMTVVALLPGFLLNKKMYVLYYSTYHKWIEVVFKLLGFFSLYIVMFNWGAFITTGILLFKTTVLPDANVSWITVDLCVNLLYFGVCFWAEAIKKWVWKIFLFSAVFLANYTAYKLGIILLKPGWFVPYALLNIVAGYAIMAYLGRYIKGRAANTT